MRLRNAQSRECQLEFEKDIFNFHLLKSRRLYSVCVCVTVICLRHSLPWPQIVQSLRSDKEFKNQRAIQRFSDFIGLETKISKIFKTISNKSPSESEIHIRNPSEPIVFAKFERRVPISQRTKKKVTFFRLLCLIESTYLCGAYPAYPAEDVKSVDSSITRCN